MTTPKHRNAAFTTSARRDYMHPSDIFIEGDRIQVDGMHTKHHGRIARVDKIGSQRLSVTFEDGLAGTYVDHNDAVVIPERGDRSGEGTPQRLKMSKPKGGVTTLGTTKGQRNFPPGTVHSSSLPLSDMEEKTTDTVRVIDSLSVAVATAISTHRHDEEMMNLLVDRFTERLHLDVRSISRKRLEEEK